MPCPHRRPHRSQTWIQTLVHVLLLAGWMVSTDGMLPGLVAVLAHLEEAHKVEVHAEADGGVRLQLVDAGLNDTDEENRLLTRLLLALAGESSRQGPAHELEFENLDEALRHQIPLIAPPSQIDSVGMAPHGWEMAERVARGHELILSRRPPHWIMAAGRVRASCNVMLC